MRFQIKTLNFNFWIFPRYPYECFTCEWDDSFWFDRAWQRPICTVIRYLMYLTLERHNRCVTHHSCFLDICSYLFHLFLNPRSHTYLPMWFLVINWSLFLPQQLRGSVKSHRHYQKEELNPCLFLLTLLSEWCQQTLLDMSQGLTKAFQEVCRAKKKVRMRQKKWSFKHCRSICSLRFCRWWGEMRGYWTTALQPNWCTFSVTPSSGIWHWKKKTRWPGTNFCTWLNCSLEIGSCHPRLSFTITQAWIIHLWVMKSKPSEA